MLNSFFYRFCLNCSGLAVCALLACLAAPVSYAESPLTIQITRGLSSAIPLAVVPFAGQGPSPVDIASVIDADLARSGRFATLPRTDQPQSPSTAATVDAAQWRLLKMDYVVVGRLVSKGEALELQFDVVNTLTGARLLGYSLPTNASSLRLAGHRAADLIYEKILGVPGAFSTRIAYVSLEGAFTARHWKLVVADSDGENAKVILDSIEPIMSPAWSPDGARLAYVSFEGRNSAVYVQTVASGQRDRVSGRAGINGAPAWSPDGSKLALTLSQSDGNLDIFVMDVASRSVVRITDDPAIDTEPCFSADGQSVYFTSDRSGRPQIYRMSLAGGKAQRVTFEGSYNARARLSMDGKSMAVVTQEGGGYRIGWVDLASGQLRVLSQGTLDVSPSIAPNGQNVMFSAREAGHGVLATVSTDGSVATRINARAGDVREPAWSPLL
jgi:TolB protein